METGRTFVISGKRHWMPGYVVTLIGMIASLLCLLAGEGTLAVVGGVMLLVGVCMHTAVVCGMAQRIILDEHGVRYRYFWQSKHFLWQDIEWIEMRDIEEGRSRYCRIAFGRTAEHAGRAQTDSISMNVPIYTCKTIACELRDFARLYASVEPQIAEEW